MAPVSTSTITPPPLTLTLLHPSWKGHLTTSRSEEHTSELQSRPHLVCRLLLEKKTQDNFGPRHHPDHGSNRRTHFFRWRRHRPNEPGRIARAPPRLSDDLSAPLRLAQSAHDHL